jgi:hypothetical protein
LAYRKFELQLISLIGKRFYFSVGLPRNQGALQRFVHLAQPRFDLNQPLLGGLAW